MKYALYSNLELLKAGVFFTFLVTLLLLETRWPRRDAPTSWNRRARNFAMVALSTVMLRVIYPLGAIGFAAAWPWGLLHLVNAPTALACAASVVLLDLAIYWQHRAFHASAWLWRVHRVHHTDTAFDVTLGVRFHPIEILLSFAYKLLIIALLGAAPVAVAIYEASLLAFSLMTHANIALPHKMDRGIRHVFVTPDWHRIHHSVHADETNSNFGNILTIWDRWFRTVREIPRDGQRSMRIGLAEFRDPASQRLLALLLQPLLSIPPAGSGTPPKEHHHA